MHGTHAAGERERGGWRGPGEPPVVLSCVPLAAEAGSVAGRASPSAMPAGTGVPSMRILIAEDDAQVRAALCSLVEALAHTPIAVPDGQVALHAVAVCSPDLVLSDIRMPAVSGLELCRRLKSDPATQHIPVVLMTALGDEQRRLALAAGANGFLNKPFGIVEFRAQVQAAVSAEQRKAPRLVDAIH